MSVLSELKERGFIEATTHTQELEDYLENNRATCYIGFDPTASSLHVGSPGLYYGTGPYAACRSQAHWSGWWRYRSYWRSFRQNRASESVDPGPN